MPICNEFLNLYEIACPFYMPSLVPIFCLADPVIVKLHLESINFKIFEPLRFLILAVFFCTSGCSLTWEF